MFPSQLSFFQGGGGDHIQVDATLYFWRGRYFRELPEGCRICCYFRGEGWVETLLSGFYGTLLCGCDLIRKLKARFSIECRK